MQNAETVLTAIRKCGSEGKPLERGYRQLFNRSLFELAYGRIYKNNGAMTPGTDTETVDGMSLRKMEVIIDLLRQERYVWKPTRRVYIEKKFSTKKRPLGIPGWSDKLVQEVIRLMLEAYYEPQFSHHSHGFRPQRGCQTALHEIRHTWRGTTWFIEGDIKGCFDNIDHDVLMGILAEKIYDNRLLRLIRGALDAGYLEDWRYHPTLSGTPQGGIISPILANIYLDRLDEFVETALLPAYNRGTERGRHPQYRKLRGLRQYYMGRGNHAKADDLLRQAQTLPSMDTHDPTYRRLRYIRYADDFLLGFAGPKSEAEEIKHLLGMFLRDSLKLELSEEKTVITHARTDSARFLGYEIHTLQEDRKHTGGRRSINGAVGFRVPVEVIKEKCQRYMQGGKPIHQTERLNDSVYAIITQYDLEYRGLVEYYRMAYNLHRFSYLQWVMETALTKTLASKLKISVKQVYKRYRVTTQTSKRPRKLLQVTVERGDKPPLVATWGNVSLTWNGTAKIRETRDPGWTKRVELLDRLNADTCELCGSQVDVEVHHIRHLKTLHKPGRKERPGWVINMAAKRRKTLVVCRKCHDHIHAGRAVIRTNSFDAGEPDDAKVSRPVRRGTDGKVPLVEVSSLPPGPTNEGGTSAGRRGEMD